VEIECQNERLNIPMKLSAQETLLYKYSQDVTIKFLQQLSIQHQNTNKRLVEEFIDFSLLNFT